ncbi:MAG: glycosyltransferase family 39 protein [Candidatus Sungiibacteriota bacterium]|uniref:Glycosyltransferase family 39 protein n=1 Tax=Candidatus Sungiibacteriota bacterium TaxID=2750080 RepID=A0A7T5RK82_9BACT|nr:MAG: glycosyltransferase family 39 protein [Candidatus Sungbacteria bacterium]
MIPKKLIIIILLALVVRLLLLSALLLNFGETGLELTDSRIFLRTANNLLAGHGFSREPEPPFLPTAFFPPLYPLLIAGSKLIASSILPVLILQIILASLMPLVVFRIGERLSVRPFVSGVAAGLTAFEPLGVLWSITVMSDVVAVFFLLLAVFFFIKLLGDFSVRSALFSGLLLGLSTLTRPHAQFLFIPAAVFLFILLLKGSLKRVRSDPAPEERIVLAAKQRALILLVFTVFFLLTLSPWLLRNYIRFGTISVSTTGVRNIYSSLGTSVMNYKTDQPYGEVQEKLYKTLALREGLTIKDLKENPAYGSLLAREGIKIMLENPKETLAVFAISINSFFTQDLYATYLRQYRVIPRFAMDFSPSVTLIKEGPGALAKLVWQRLGVLFLIPLAGRIFWIFLTILGALGAFLAVKRGGAGRVIALLLALLIIYYATTSIVAGFSDYGRHRYPVNTFIFLLASYGLFSLGRVKFLKKHPTP